MATDRLPLIIGFARVSQASEDLGNLDTQRRLLLDHGVHEVVTEVGSGVRTERQALRSLRERLQSGDTLVVTHTDRISRRALELLAFLRHLDDAGVHLVVLSIPGFDTSTPPLVAW